MIRLIHGDCLQEMRRLIDEGVKVDAIITDPPYGTTACSWDVVIPFEPMWECLNSLIKPKGAVVLFGSEPFSSYLRLGNIKNYKYDWVWNKKSGANILLLKYQPLKIHENIIVFNTHKYYPIHTMRETIKANYKTTMPKILTKTNDNPKKTIYIKDYSTRHPKSIITYTNADRTGIIHPTQKPVALMEYLIKTYTKENEIVLDFTMGSGTTGVACKITRRNFIGIEKDKKYYNISYERIIGYKYDKEIEKENQEKGMLF